MKLIKYKNQSQDGILHFETYFIHNKNNSLFGVELFNSSTTVQLSIYLFFVKINLFEYRKKAWFSFLGETIGDRSHYLFMFIAYKTITIMVITYVIFLCFLTKQLFPF